ncbi:DUF4262 domain-containing protein [Chryseobacterium potabilaquae]|uniref:DUF4262 domain-containing protein n=1 Tax=Chryseobacterium potabilaquae TaxID=2675057 RepID=A0A6N4X994_9FLAO|nr:DUF4262 domain-containing protein [Chryseobacterium potabilaquae]CAA7196832.1 hypothetical protein CHRY9293_02899 [Chryseobacterium potabilaquae]
MDNTKEFKETIRKNIEENFCHITVVTQSEVPRYAYTIGIYEKFNLELIIAGNENFLYDEILFIINKAVTLLNIENLESLNFSISNLGSFKLIKIHHSWARKMMLGVYDYYDLHNFDAYQILPDENHYSLDIPNMSLEWNLKEQSVWKWLDENVVWDWKIPSNSKIITNLEALFGTRITEVMRWEEDEWQGFTMNGEEIGKNDIRILPIATILGIDNSLAPITNLDIGKGLWRDSEELRWKNWG